MKIFLKILFVVFFLSAVVSPSEARDDWEYWGTSSIKTSLRDNLVFKAAHEHRLRDNLGNFYLANGAVWLLWKPSKFFEIGPHYKFEYEESNSTGKNTDEHRIGGEASLKASIEEWKISNRHRFVYRNVSGNEFWRWRTRLKVSHPLSLGSFKITPFVSEEIFWDTRQEEFNQNRAALGVSRKLTQNVSLDVYYLLRSDRSGGDWNERHVLGTGVGFSF